MSCWWDSFQLTSGAVSCLSDCTKLQTKPLPISLPPQPDSPVFSRSVNSPLTHVFFLFCFIFDFRTPPTEPLGLMISWDGSGKGYQRSWQLWICSKSNFYSLLWKDECPVKSQCFKNEHEAEFGWLWSFNVTSQTCLFQSGISCSKQSCESQVIYFVWMWKWFMSFRIVPLYFIFIVSLSTTESLCCYQIIYHQIK